MSKTKNNANSLLAAIQRKLPTEPAKEQALAQAEPETVAAPADARNADRVSLQSQKPKRRVGKAVQFWLHDDDRKLVRELAAWLAGQGERPTDSLVIRTALRISDTGGRFLAAYRKALAQDGRLKARDKG